MTCLCSSVNGDLRRRSTELRRSVPDLANDAISELFQAAADATEEAIYNSLFMATTVRSRDGTVEALPVAEVLKLLQGRGTLTPARSTGK